MLTDKPFAFTIQTKGEPESPDITQAYQSEALKHALSKHKGRDIGLRCEQLFNEKCRINKA